MIESEPLKSSLPPGEYSCVLRLPVSGEPEREIFGTIELYADAPPRGTMRGPIPYEQTTAPGGYISSEFPQRIEVPAITGSLTNGSSVTLLDVTIGIWPGDVGLVSAKAALVGHVSLGDDGVPLFKSAKIQLQHLDALAGSRPIGELSLPNGNKPHLSGTWTVTGNPDSTLEWSEAGMELGFSYDGSTSFLTGYGFHMAFSPVVELKSSIPLSFDQWLGDWIRPLRQLICVSTGQRERITYLALESDEQEPEEASFGGRARAEVFGTGITQEPYASSDRDIRENPSAINLAADGLSLLELIRRWKAAESTHHPLVETYGAFAGNPPQHPRAQYLLLLQALEGAHGYDTRADRLSQEDTHDRRREEFLRTQAISCLPKEDLTFLKKYLSRKPYFGGLAEAVRYYLGAAPEDLSPELEHTPLVRATLDEGATSMPDALRIVRNALAHGSRGYDVSELHDVARILERLTRARILQVLGCPSASQIRALKPPPN